MRLSINRTKSAALIMTALVLILGGAGQAKAGLITNGGFEAGLAGWTELDEAGGSGSWYVQTGTGSPNNGFAVPAPPEGTNAAMTDQYGPGSHVLYQDFVVPAGVTSATLNFQRFINNQAGTFYSPTSLDYGVVPNQQARVDVITTTADPFSVAAGDVLDNVFQTEPGDPTTSGYTLDSTSLTSLLQAHAGQTLRLRFAETDNQTFFNFGIDAVSLDVNTASAAPEPASLTLLGAGVVGLMGCAGLRRHKKAAPVA